ncbi:uncharacterized protein KY384_003447 [Bacidia gigantensis]|uniref:uncharacterized protein n=1 Tax=Bacidia gigantensis TaxID=2732470 RepID=UPI001D04A5C7|nr:uncharacterized protein KY384_003447 [Bacidia gigantensis]KAG8531811.1 hypothetical protein KY384_003447 [Bacidia gigantensis]
MVMRIAKRFGVPVAYPNRSVPAERDALRNGLAQCRARVDICDATGPVDEVRLATSVAGSVADWSTNILRDDQMVDVDMVVNKEEEEDDVLVADTGVLVDEEEVDIRVVDVDVLPDIEVLEVGTLLVVGLVDTDVLEDAELGNLEVEDVEADVIEELDIAVLKDVDVPETEVLAEATKFDAGELVYVEVVGLTVLLDVRVEVNSEPNPALLPVLGVETDVGTGFALGDREAGVKGVAISGLLALLSDIDETILVLLVLYGVVIERSSDVGLPDIAAEATGIEVVGEAADGSAVEWTEAKENDGGDELMEVLGDSKVRPDRVGGLEAVAEKAGSIIVGLGTEGGCDLTVMLLFDEDEDDLVETATRDTEAVAEVDLMKADEESGETVETLEEPLDLADVADLLDDMLEVAGG